jgi:hypothetical protein
MALPLRYRKEVAETRLGSGDAFILDISTEDIAIALPTLLAALLSTRPDRKFTPAIY